MKIILRILPLFIIIAAVLMTSSCYYLRQGSVLISQRSEAKNFSRSLKKYRDDSTREQQLRDFFNEVQAIKDFGTGNLGLSADKNYSKYLEVEGDYLVAVVNASPADSLAPYLWKYPFFGPAPYRGYYRKEDAVKEADRLKQQGYDVWVRKVDGFSTLGFTKDPLISFMMDYSPFDLAQLIIHEQIHATYWVPHAIQFNEELATTLGQMGALEYLINRYGEDSDEYRSARAQIDDSRVFAADMRDLASRLDDYYRQAREQNLGEDDIIREKNVIISGFQTEFTKHYDENFSGEGYRGFGEMEINNAFISLYRTYSGRSTAYEDLYRKTGSVLKTVTLVKSALEDPAAYGIDYQKGDDPFVIIQGLNRYIDGK